MGIVSIQLPLVALSSYSTMQHLKTLATMEAVSDPMTFTTGKLLVDNELCALIVTCCQQHEKSDRSAINQRRTRTARHVRSDHKYGIQQSILISVQVMMHNILRGSKSLLGSLGELLANRKGFDMPMCLRACGYALLKGLHFATSRPGRLQDFSGQTRCQSSVTGDFLA